MDALTLLSYGLVGFLIAPVLVLVLASLHKETRHEQPLRGILWFGVAMMALCAVVILFTTLHRATALGKINRIETAPSQIR
jgi:hypothetical protein